MSKYSNDSRDARARSKKYQAGGYIDPSQERLGKTQTKMGWQDSASTGAGGFFEGMEDKNRTGYHGMTHEEAISQRAYDQDEERKKRRREQAGRFFGEIGGLLGINRKSGVFGSEGILGKPIEKAGKWLSKVFSDVHLKENIDFVGKSDSGINVYEWNYNNDKKNRYRGVLAHELKQNHEDAVIKTDKGLAVDYDKIDVEFKKVK